MLFLMFQLGGDRYALDVRQIAEVLPLVDLKQIPQTPPGVAGVFEYRGAPVPAIDLSQLLLGQPAERRLSTRIVLVHYAIAGGASRLLGLIAEKATETLRREPAEFSASGITNEAVPGLGPVTSEARGFIQWLEVSGLLPTAVRDVLFQPTACD